MTINDFIRRISMAKDLQEFIAIEEKKRPGSVIRVKDRFDH
mgnify:CR=1 FL=1